MKMTWAGKAVMAAMVCVAGSVMVAQARPAPEFTLTDIAGKTHTLAEYKGKVVVLEWTNPDCPFVKRHYNGGVDGNMPKLQIEYTSRGVIWLSINSSAAGKQGNYSADAWVKIQAERGAAPTATLLDADGTAGHAYGAKTTPHMFVINAEGEIVYEGAIDDNNEDLVSAKNHVAEALDAVLAGKPVEIAATAPYGCGVKY